MRFLALSFTLVLAVLFSTMKVLAEEEHALQSAQVEGTAVIMKNNLARAQEDAIRDALRRVVEKSLVQFLPSGLRISKDRTLKKNIYSTPDKYIQTYKIMSEGPSQNMYVVDLIATIDNTALKDDLITLGIVVSEKGRIAVGTIYMIVHGIQTYTEYKRLLELLRNGIEGVKNVAIRYAQWGMVKLDVEADCSSQVLADKVGRSGKFSFNLNKVDENQLEITLMD
jgi:hypothetical protein